MKQSVRESLAVAVMRILRPIARILLRNGVSYGTFSEWARHAFVEVARDDFIPPGGRQTISHISALTGLTRKETRRQLDLTVEASIEAEERYNRAVRVIGGWLNDPLFTDAKGMPKPLTVDGGEDSFASLVRRYSGDIPTQAMLSVLVAAGTVVRKGDRVVLQEHAYVPGDDPVEKIHIFGTDVAELVNTIDYNLHAGDQPLRYQRKVSNPRLREDQVERFHQLASRKAQILLEDLDEWLTRHEANVDEPGRFVSLGIYYYQEDEED